jgi:hypothetical protein
VAAAGAGPARTESDTIRSSSAAIRSCKCVLSSWVAYRDSVTTLETPVTASTTLAEESYPRPSQAVRSGLVLLRQRSNTIRFGVHVEESDGASLLCSPRFGSALVIHSEYKMSYRREVPLSNNNNTC